MVAWTISSLSIGAWQGLGVSLSTLRKWAKWAKMELYETVEPPVCSRIGPDDGIVWVGSGVGGAGGPQIYFDELERDRE